MIYIYNDVPLYMMRFDLDEPRGYEGCDDGADDEPEGEVEEGFLVREHVEEGGEPRVELVERLHTNIE